MITRNRTVLTLAVVAMVMLVLTAASSNAALVVEEQFIYEAAMLDTLNGGTGFDGPWVATKSHGRDYYVGLTEFADQKPLNDDSGLSFSTLPVAGSALSRFGSAGRAAAHRLLSAASQATLTHDNTTIWFSQLFAGPAANRGAMFIFGTQPLNHTDLHTMAAPGSGFGFSIHNPSDGPISAVAFNNSVDVTIESGVLYTPDPITAVSLIVGKINWKPNGTPDEYFLFNVTDLATEPAEATAIASITNLDFDQSAFNQIALCDGTSSVTDEIRFGNSFADVMGVALKASNPGPEDDAMLEDTWVSLSWSPGASAVSHDVYLGDNFDDVNDGLGDTFQGNQALDSLYFVAGFTGYAYPDGLVSGTTYYWRIDEVNDADPNSPWKGDIWSFTVPSDKAYEPAPANGAKFTDLAVTMSWTAGFGAKLRYVYFGEDYDTVANATDGLLHVFTEYSPGPLEFDKTYYWRVDESDGDNTYTGDVWSFSTMPDILIADPNLVGWWKFETGARNKVIDFSGHDNHGTIVDKVLWVPGQFNLALEFLGDNQGHVELPARIVTTASGSVAMWVNTDQTGTSDAYAEGMFWYGTETGGDGFGDQNEIHLHNQGTGALGFWMRGTTDVGLDGPMLAGTGWNHVAVTWDQTDGCRLYFNGLQVDFQIHTGNVVDLAVIRLGRPAGNFRFHDGLLDDVRLFDHAITAEQVSEIMTKGEDPLKAGAPSPGNGSVAALTVAEMLTWSAGEGASQHDVYFGADKAVVEDADASDTDGTYRGSQSGTSYTPPEGVEWGGGPYYWRIDENNNDGTVTKGTVWTFTVADFTLIDDFEDYDIGNNEIWFAWNDGIGAGTLGVPPYVPSNGTGSMVGDDTNLNSYTEESIVHSGNQSMPYWYDNNKQGFNRYSEAKLTLTEPHDWTKNEVKELSLWFRGYPAYVGSFVEGPVGTYTMTGSGADIWGTADKYHFAFKTLTGVGSIQARVLSVDNTNVWAKAGVMIRETLEPGSVHATMVVTPGQGISFQRRTVTDGSSSNTDTGAIVAPYWVKIERDIAGNFSASSSTNGSTWTPLGVFENIPMGSNVYIGLAVTSHDAALTCQAVFSNVTTTGNVSPLWANQDIGITSNDAEPLYVAVSNSSGAPAVVVHDDPAAAQIDTWTEWVIPLQDLADQGIVLSNIDSIAIGVGTQGNISIPGGSGKMYFDDIRLYRPRNVAEE